MGIVMLLLLLASIVLIVVASSRLKLHPFISLMFASLFLGLGTAALGQFDIQEIIPVIRNGFGHILTHIGIVIVLGSIIGVFLEKSGAALKMADTVIKIVGPKRPELAMSFIGWIVSIPVFCDSGFIILNAMRKSVTRKTRTRAASMGVALSTGLYASHTLIPPTPGPIAAAGNLGLENTLGIVILFGFFISTFPMMAGYLWARFIGNRVETREDLINEELYKNGLSGEKGVEIQYGNLPSSFISFSPIVVPILLIAIGTILSIPFISERLGFIADLLIFLGNPLMALLVGFLFALTLAPALNEEVLMKWIGSGIRIAGPIILITGAGGAFGAIIKATPISEFLGNSLSSALLGGKIGILLPFILAAALKTAQGSTTTTMVTVSALMAPLLVSLGLNSVMGSVLTVMSIGAGAMAVSHANDSYFWVVAEFTGMDIKTAYRSHTAATGIQGGITMLVVLVLSFILL